ncbi:hypothetical protein WICMUC_005506 [Wickerhamomyces mucosus]|uniref:CRAL-TRIO domain-containing protein n=1 Tax=Wickerhamomyces mucosus TaxID=1378264 RepID=A0A9P8P8L8_9ASCO|nr:hypothetical protein WICMUC_005506 [Wickerhamomyces mucosus]
MFRSLSKNSIKSSSSSSSLIDESKWIPVNTPYLKPDSIKTPDDINLSKDEEIKYNEVLEYFNRDDFVVRSTEKDDIDSEKLPLFEEEKIWLSKECLLRYLRATKWKVSEAIKRIELSLGWRREFGLIPSYKNQNVEILTSDLISHENSTGKSVILGYDKTSRPILYLKNGRQNTKPSIRQVQNLVYFLESTITFMPKNQEKIALIIDYKHYNVEGTTAKIPSLSISKQVLHILQTHYPERLGKAFFANIPYLAYSFMKIMNPFIDPITREKIVLEEGKFTEFIDNEQLDKDYEGLLKFEYNHEQYWPALSKSIKDLKSSHFEKFKELGGSIGLSESKFKSV